MLTVAEAQRILPLHDGSAPCPFCEAVSSVTTLHAPTCRWRAAVRFLLDGHDIRYGVESE